MTRELYTVQVTDLDRLSMGWTRSHDFLYFKIAATVQVAIDLRDLDDVDLHEQAAALGKLSDIAIELQAKVQLRCDQVERRAGGQADGGQITFPARLEAMVYATADDPGREGPGLIVYDVRKPVTDEPLARRRVDPQLLGGPDRDQLVTAAATTALADSGFVPDGDWTRRPPGAFSDVVWTVAVKRAPGPLPLVAYATTSTSTAGPAGVSVVELGHAGIVGRGQIARGDDRTGIHLDGPRGSLNKPGADGMLDELGFTRTGPWKPRDHSNGDCVWAADVQPRADQAASVQTGGA